MAWVHGLYRTRRSLNHNTEQETLEDDRYDCADARGVSQIELSKSVRITRELLLRLTREVLLQANLWSPIWH